MSDLTADYLLKKYSLDRDYAVLPNEVLGLGINGKVLACKHRISGKKFALKVSLAFNIITLKTRARSLVLIDDFCVRDILYLHI